MASTLLEYHSKVTKALLSIAAALIFGLMLYITGDVLARYLFNHPLPNSFSIGTTALVLAAFLSFSYVQLTRGNIELEFLTRHFSPFWQGIFNILSATIALALFGLVFWGSLGWSIEAWRSKEYMEDVFPFPYWPSRFAVAIGSFVLSITYLIDFIKYSSDCCLGLGQKENNEPPFTLD